MKKEKKITVVDIAEKLGIAHSTVSRALRDSPLISEKTRQLVRETAEHMNYTPPSSARRRGKKQTNIIELIYFTLAEHIQQDPMLLLILDRLNVELEKLEYHVMLNIIKEKFHSSKAVLNQESGVVDGTIIVTHQLIPAKCRYHLNPARCVLMDNRLPGYFSVNFDTDNDMTLIFDHLISKGCRTVLGVVHPEFDKAHALSQRVFSFEKACKIHHQEIKSLGLVRFEPGASLKSILTAKPEAIVFTHLDFSQFQPVNNFLANELAKTEIITYSDIDLSGKGGPTYPHIRIDWEEIVRRTADCITRLVKNPETKPNNIFVQNTFIVP